MHTLVFVTFNKGHATDELEARKYCEEKLQNDGFADLQKRFGGGWGDGFVVGGRWSGLLTEHESDQPASEPKQVLLSSDYGREGDAQIVTQQLYDKHLSEYEGDNEVEGEFLDLDYDEVSPAYIGNKWLVVIDLHG